ncbi:MAG: cob(I)yrinic acid a,c-diamide adenosyltransferase [Candidatus Latescibacterota bacterium]
MHGCIQIYTGNGKGKTTAALGLALRAFGAGMRVFFGQFMKCGDYSELAALRMFGDAVTVRQFGLPGFVLAPGEEDREAARRGFTEAQKAAVSGEYGLVILDEACTAAHFGLLAVEDLLELTERKHEGTELVFTGRYCPPSLVERADLVTEMLEVKHYYHAGVKARKGIEE